MEHAVRLATLFIVVIVVAVLLWSCAHSRTSEYFVIHMVDDETDCGVPFVELKLPNEVKYWTDSAGVAALDEPSLRNRDVFLSIRSHGYEYPEETPLGRGITIRIEPGKKRELRVRRTIHTGTSASSPPTHGRMA